MTCRLSIFSFKTLQGSFRPGAAALLALALLAVAETGVRILTPNLGWYEGLSSLGQWVDRLRYEIKTRNPDIWLLGNSVLAYGVDIESLEYLTSKSAVSLPFGGATVAGDVAMLKYFLSQTPNPPNQVVFCITKDDLNLHGERAAISKTYINYDTWRGLSPERILHLADSRSTLFNHLKFLILGRATASALQPSEPSFQGIATPEKVEYMQRLFADFDLDIGIFPHIRALANQYGFSVAFVLMPVSEVYIRLHDETYPNQPCSEVHAYIGRLAKENGFAFHDLSALAPSQFDLFSDPYHLTAEGRRRTTPLLAQTLGIIQRSAPLRVACIGDSITYGTGLPNRSTQSYPAQLQRLSRGRFEVGNFGVSGTTLLKNSRRAWIDTPALPAAMAFHPDAVILLFGVNEIAHPDILDQLPADGIDLASRFQDLPSHPALYLCTPTPIAPRHREKASNKTLQNVVIPHLFAIAEKTGAHIIDLNHSFPNTQKLLPDTTHPNEEGAHLIAQTILDALAPR